MNQIYLYENSFVFRKEISSKRKGLGTGRYLKICKTHEFLPYPTEGLSSAMNNDKKKFARMSAVNIKGDILKKILHSLFVS